MCASRGGDINLFVRKGGASQKKIGKHCSNISIVMNEKCVIKLTAYMLDGILIQIMLYSLFFFH